MKTEIDKRITEIIKVYVIQINPDLLDIVSENELLDEFNRLQKECVKLNLKHDGYTLFKAVVRKLSSDKFNTGMYQNTTNATINWIQYQMNLI